MSPEVDDAEFPPDFTPAMKNAARALMRLDREQFKYLVALERQRRKRRICALAEAGD